MLFKILSYYKLSLLLSLTLALALVALRVETNPFLISLIILGTVLGTFVMDIDYLIYAFFLEPTADISKDIASFIKHGDLYNAITYLKYHKDEIKEKTLHSALFQAILAGSCIFVVASNANLFIKALIISALANSLYQFAQIYFEGKVGDWFWVLKDSPTKFATLVYTTLILAALIYSLFIF